MFAMATWFLSSVKPNDTPVPLHDDVYLVGKSVMVSFLLYKENAG